MPGLYFSTLRIATNVEEEQQTQVTPKEQPAKVIQMLVVRGQIHFLEWGRAQVPGCSRPRSQDDISSFEQARDSTTVRHLALLSNNFISVMCQFQHVFSLSSG